MCACQMPQQTPATLWPLGQVSGKSASLSHLMVFFEKNQRSEFADLGLFF